MSDFVYQDQLDPDGYELVVTPGADNFDLSTVATATFRGVRRSDNSEFVWTAALSNQSSSSLTLTYLFTASDIDTVKGTYDIYARMLITGSGKPQRTPTKVFVVKGKYEAE